MISRNQTAVFSDHLRLHAHKYFPGFEPEQIRVKLLDQQERPTALVYQFAVSDENQIRSVYVKVLRRSSPEAQIHRGLYEKPLLYPKTDTEDRHRLQYTALKTIYDYFMGLDKKQLGAIRVLDYLPHYQAIFTEGSSDTALRQLFLRRNRLRSLFARDDLSVAFQNVGIWLRIYHTMPKEKDVKVRYSHRDDYIAAITKLTEFLGKALQDEPFFQKVASITINKCREVLPESLPLGLGHGDFAMRNIFIGENSRVTVFDTFAKWRTPIYEDIGYFLTDLKMSSIQILSQGLAFRPDELAAYEHSFLKGYFENEPIPYAALWLYETLALLDKWSSALSKFCRRQGFLRSLSQPVIILINQYFKKRTKGLLAKLN